jgi:hypothetical protein
MKAIQLLLLLFSLTPFLSFSQSQNETDQIIINVEHPQAIISINLQSVKDVTSFWDFHKEIDMVVRNMENLDVDTTDPDLLTKITVTVGSNKEMTLQLRQYLPENIRYIQDENMHLHKTPKDSLLIRYPHNQNVTIALHNIEDLQLLKQIKWDDLLEEHSITSNYRRIHRREIVKDVLLLKDKNHKLQRIETDKSSNDQLLFTLYLGTGVYNNNLMMHFGSEVSFQFAGKSYFKQCIGLSFESLLDFEEQNGKTERHINGFIDLFYEFNTTQWSSITPSFFRLNLGYLITRNSDLFKKNTFRLGITKDLGHNLRITPELYFPGNFKNVNPGLKISYCL